MRLAVEWPIPQHLENRHPALLKITQQWDSDDKGAVIQVRGPGVTITIAINDRTKPIPLDETDKALMEVARQAMLRMGVKASRLRRRDATYALWAIAQHLKASVGAISEQLEFGGVALPTKRPLRIGPVWTSVSGAAS